MIRLLKIDFRKLKSYRTFWVLNTMYYFLIASIPISIYEFLKWLKGKGVDFDEFDPTRIPISHFPDVWQNLTYIYVFLKFFLAIIVIISITNEYTYKTIRQNIIDGRFFKIKTLYNCFNEFYLNCFCFSYEFDNRLFIYTGYCSR